MYREMPLPPNCVQTLPGMGGGWGRTTLVGILREGGVNLVRGDSGKGGLINSAAVTREQRQM